MPEASNPQGCGVISAPMRGEDTRRCPPDGWHVLGLMSGTSVDGLDVASARISGGTDETPWRCDLQAFATLPYPEDLRDALWHAMEHSAEGLARLDKRWATWSGKAVQRWMADHNVSLPDLVSSHGHTVFHRPQEGWTVQVGCGATLHAALGVPVVCDFRRLDVAHGGQGAPLVPLADRELFGAWDVALNLGGFANLSLERPGEGRVAWDVGPANLLLNLLVQTRGLTMDQDGALAQNGTAIPELVEAWQGLPYHGQPAPKSLGREWLEREVWPLAARALATTSLEDVLATAIAYASWAVARDVPPGSRVLVTGGGAFNPALMSGLRDAGAGKNITWHVPDADLVNGKEALVFAWLGLLRWLDLPNALPSVTGARVAAAGGALWGPGPRT